MFTGSFLLIFFSIFNSDKWESVQDDLITVVSYNVLSQVLLERHRYLYKKNDETCLSWDFRSRILLQELEDFNADVRYHKRKNNLGRMQSILYTYNNSLIIDIVSTRS